MSRRAYLAERRLGRVRGRHGVAQDVGRGRGWSEPAATSQEALMLLRILPLRWLAMAALPALCYLTSRQTMSPLALRQ